MNKTHLSNESKPKHKRLQSSQMPTRSSPFPIIPDEIHKVPESVRKAIKVGKYRRNYNKMPNPQESNNKLHLEYQSEKQKMKIDLQVKPIVQHYGKNGQFEEQTQKETIIENIKNEPPRIRSNGDRVLYVKKKLSPLKRGFGEPISIPTRDKRNLKITFLNIEKLELVKMYENINESKGNLSPMKKKVGMASSLIDKKTGNEFIVENFLQSTTFSSKNSHYRKSFHEGNSPATKLKPFVPPFDRYNYRDFLWKVAFENGYKLTCPESYSQKFKIFIGRGNNSMLIKSLFKRRNYWWCFTDKYDEAHFVWTQIKINQIFHVQENNESVYDIFQNGEELQTLNKNSQSYLNHSKFMSDENILMWNQYFTKYRRVEDKLSESMTKRNKIFGMLKQLQVIKKQKLKIHNHLPNNYVLGNKKALFHTMSNYYQKTKQNVFDYLPLTFHIQNGLEDNEYLKFLNHFYERAKKLRMKEKARKTGTLDEADSSPKLIRNMWIVKPGEFTNRGNGINVCMNLEEIKKILKKRQKHENGKLKTYIIQSYLERPFLYQRRKFDIRHFIMMTSIGGRIKGYWYQFGYIRTTSFQYSLNNSFTSVHLTNDAVQKYLPQYGKYQKGNKISYEQFQKYLDKEYSGRFDFFSDIYPKLKKISTDAIKASSLTIDPERKGHNFQIFGLDFMIDCDFNPWLIEVNNNPCLEQSCPLLDKIVPDMLENAFRICIDSLIPPPENFPEKKPKFNDNAIEKNNFEIVYDSFKQQQMLAKLFHGELFDEDLDYKELQKEEDEIFEDDGMQLDD